MYFKVSSKLQKSIIRKVKHKDHRILYVVANISAILSVLFLYLFIMNDNPVTSIDFVLGFSISFIGSIILHTLTHSISKSIVTGGTVDRGLLLEGSTLYRTYQSSLSVEGKRITDVSGYELRLDLTTVKEILYDKYTKRIEFYVSGEQIVFHDVFKRVVKTKVNLDSKKYKCVFYDCYEPSLVKALESLGLPIKDL